MGSGAGAQLQQRESIVMTAEDSGLEAYEALFRNRPAAVGVDARGRQLRLFCKLATTASPSRRSQSA